MGTARKKHHLTAAFALIGQLCSAQQIQVSGACQLGGANPDYIGDIALDGNGYVYVIGTLDQQIVVGKRKPDCQWVWMETWGTSGSDRGLGIELDQAGHVYLTGFLNSGAVSYAGETVGSATGGLFVAQLDTSSTWNWIATSTVWSVNSAGIVVDDAGDVYVSGDHNPAFEPMTFGSILVPTNGNDDVFLAKVSADGEWQWAKDLYSAQWLGVQPSMSFSDIEVGKSGSIAIGGRFAGYEAIFDADTIETTHHYPCGEGVAFYLASYRPDGTVNWARTADPVPAGLSDLRAILPQADGTLSALISYGDTLHLGASTMISEWATCLAHFDTDGSVLSADPLQDHTATNILDAVQDEAGVIYTVSLLSLPVVIGVNSFTSAGGFDVVLGAVVGTSGVEGLRLGGIADEWGGKLRTSGNGLVMAGSFADVMSVGSDILTSSGGLDMYITRMSTGTLDVSRPYVDRTGLLLAPNPVGERATLCIPKELQREPVRLFDHAGRCLRTFSPGHPQLSLDITGLASGTYLLRCGPSTIVLVKE